MPIVRLVALALLTLWPLAAAAQAPGVGPVPGVRDARATHLQPAAKQERLAPRAQPPTGPGVETVLPPGGAPAPHALAGAGAATLNLADAQGFALANHPSLAAAAARVEAARGLWLQAGLGPNPEIGYAASEVGNEGRAGQQGGFVSQEFVTGGKLRLNREVAARDIALAEQRFAAQRLRVANDVRIAFYETLISQRRTQVAADLVKIAQQGITAAEGLRKAKEASTADVLRAQIETENARIELARSEYQWQAAWQTLSVRMGLPRNGRTEVARPILVGDAATPAGEYGWDEALERLLHESPEMAAAAVRVERARWVLTRAQAEPVPNVTLQGGLQYDNATRDTIGNFQASIPIPLFNRNQGNILAARSELRAAEADLERVGLALQQRLAEVYAHYAAARRQAAGYRESILGKAKDTLERVGRAYRLGEFSYTDMLSAQRTYSEANLTYLSALRELRGAEARIEGLLLTGSLEDQAATTP
jgi:cobalt-zinc-cadmium efflux system outer membrane protein